MIGGVEWRKVKKKKSKRGGDGDGVLYHILDFFVWSLSLIC